MKPDEGAFVDAVRIGDGDAGRVVGQSLRALRQAAGLSQSELARPLGIGQGPISKIGQHGDVQISLLQSYVEALGASLRIDATFPNHSELGRQTEPKIGCHTGSSLQYVFPIFGRADSDDNQTRDIVLSIKPNYSEKILQGKKTIELRRRFPISVSQGSTAYIYSTSPDMALVGSVRIDGIERLPLKILWRKHGKSASIRKPDFDKNFSELEEGFALKLSEAHRFARPLSLLELKERFDFKAPQSFLYAKPNLQKALRHEHTNIFD
ncbi:helix-turn-helix domain-containing protein [Azospirillum brasilense]|nr:helix-turn-helix domain-containing protein [Azospirillum brasilense]